MDPILIEETKNLDRIEKKIDHIVNAYKARKAALLTELSDFVCYDYEDRVRLVEKRRELQSEEKQIEQFQSYKPSPYFARMDLDTEIDGANDIETKVLFIGKEGIHQGSESLVIDWRSDIGQYYYMKTERNFTINGYQYQLALRRALSIEGGKLLSYNTEYDSSNVTLEGDIIDPFLLTVLRDKRRHNRLTDIIRTIQANQNDIIRLPKQESFVVQGCAGSGKTMILLHRLSFLLFNNRHLHPATVKIITPNKFFDAHINDLSHELGLDQIPRFTVEEYYAELIHRFSSKIDVDSSVASEKGLSEALLKSIYSQEYVERFTKHYHDYWNDITQKLAELGLPQVFEKCNKKYPAILSHESKTFEALYNSTSEIQRDVNRYQEEKKRLGERLSAIQEQLISENNNHAEVTSQISRAKEKAIRSLHEELASLEHLATDYRLKFQKEKEKRQAIAAEIEKYTREIATLSDQANEISRNYDSYQRLDVVSRINDNVSQQLLATTADIRLEYEKAKSSFEETPFYSFGRRNAIRRQIEDLETQYTNRVQKFLHEIENKIKDQLQNSEKQLAATKEENASSKKNEEDLDELLRNVTIRKNAAVTGVTLLSDREYPDVAALLPKQDYAVVAPLAYEYVNLYPKYKESAHRVEKLQRSEAVCTQEKKQKALPITEKEQRALLECESLVAQLRISDISRNVLFKDLLAEYRSFSQPYHKENYRHKLYLRLLLCSLYYPTRISGDLFVNIDEAQDIAIPEYRLLHRILGANCVFNLYGDVNQLVYSYKGISNWDEIREITGGNVYALNENYRNTVQITEFCNEQFHAEVYPIGISGAPVQLLTLPDAIQEILALSSDVKAKRIAIIHRFGRIKIVNALQEAIPKDKASWGVIDNQLISVISVETAKGLEFDIVVVITDSLTENEKYIAFTRALDRLIVVSDVFPSEEKQDDYFDEVDDLLSVTIPENDPQFDDIQTSTNNDAGMVDVDQPESEDNNASITQPPDFSHIEQLISNAFQEEYKLSPQQSLLLSYLEAGENVACTAPSGWSKSILLYAVAFMNHREGRGQTLLTAEGHLQENELVLADRLGLRAGILNGSIYAFDADFKKNKYDVIFVPYDYFIEDGNSKSFIQYFSGKISYWGVDHPSSEVAIWRVIQKCAADMECPLYLMSKEGFSGIDITGFRQMTVESEVVHPAQKIHFFDVTQKNEWFSENKDLLFGQGLVYCDSEIDCKKIARTLRKAKINAQAYLKSSDFELINYLTNTFSNGGLPVLVTTQHFGKNLTNPRLRFVVHYDVPDDREVYDIHLGQIGSLAHSPEVIDFYVL